MKRIRPTTLSAYSCMIAVPARWREWRAGGESVARVFVTVPCHVQLYDAGLWRTGACVLAGVFCVSVVTRNSYGCERCHDWLNLQ